MTRPGNSESAREQWLAVRKQKKPAKATTRIPPPEDVQMQPELIQEETPPQDPQYKMKTLIMEGVSLIEAMKKIQKTQIPIIVKELTALAPAVR